MISEVSNHLWQSTVFAMMVGLLTLAFRKNRAQVRYWLWFSASLKFLIPFSLLLTLGSYLGRTQAAKSVAAPAISYTVVQIAEPFPAASVPAPSTPSHADWIPIAVVSLWTCGFAGIALIRLRGWLRIRAAARSSVPMDIPFPIEVRSSPALLEPGVVGLFRPILLCPKGIVERLAPSQLEAILAHERCHIQRHDNLTAAIHMIVEAVFWFHPLVWWISARLMEERERACDEGVLESGSEPQVYAESILKTCEFCVESPLACVTGVTGADLKKRIVRIMTEGLADKLCFGRKMLLAALGIAVVAGPVIFGVVYAQQIRAQAVQTTSAPLPSFEVASIKPDRSGDLRSMMETRPQGLKASDATAKKLIAYAYNVEEFQVSSGPSWVSSDKYYVQAKVEDSIVVQLQKLPDRQQEDQMRLMVQSLLADRFKLKVSHGTKELPIYALVIAKNGPKLQESKPGDTNPSAWKRSGGSGHASTPVGVTRWTDRGASMPNFADQLSRHLRQTVLDRTGLKAKYTFTLEFADDRTRPAMLRASDDGDLRASNGPLPESSGPSIFTALQEQLGLKLESTKGPVDIIVIDHIERPSEN
jgi:uncharacterized protein (TIGR03435 family)